MYSCKIWEKRSIFERFRILMCVFDVRIWKRSNNKALHSRKWQSWLFTMNITRSNMYMCFVYSGSPFFTRFNHELRSCKSDNFMFIDECETNKKLHGLRSIECCYLIVVYIKPWCIGTDKEVKFRGIVIKIVAKKNWKNCLCNFVSAIRDKPLNQCTAPIFIYVIPI